MTTASVGVVVPTLDEEQEIGATLDALLVDPPCPLDVVVADGHSGDRTAAIAAARGARVIVAPRSRARQMNAGARAVTGDVLVFLHADTRIGRGHLESLLAALAEPRVSHGSFAIRLEPASLGYALVAAAANLRTRLDRTPYGDQALFVRRAAFEAVGGFPEVPLLEDVLLGRALRRTGRYVFLRQPMARTSARQWQRVGLVRGTLVNWAARGLFEIGIAPARVAAFRERHYGPGGGMPPAER